VLGYNLSRGSRAVQFCIHVRNLNINDAIRSVSPTTLNEDVATFFVGPVEFESFHLRGVNVWSILDFGGATRVYSGFATDH
jgi:hypothetical protein